MKKVLIADLIKAVKEEVPETDPIVDAAERWQVTTGEVECLIDLSTNEADWDDIMMTAEALEIGICDVTEDDVENLNLIWDLGGSRGKSYSTIESSIGKVHPWYDPILKSLMILIIFDVGNPANYPVSSDELNRITGSGSFGKYYSENIRNNEAYSDIPGAWGCIGPDPDSPKRLMTAEDKAKLPQDLQLLV